MADEAFALSPISARATLPGEEDYAAIAEAFMETSRGRWFLTEYAKRNRNADTRMVLDAVSQLEQSLAAQREEERKREANLQREEGLSAQQAAEAVAAAAAAQERLTEALAAIRDSVEAAEESAVEALDALALEHRLAPVRKGARVLREIAWRLREIGNDGRICDLIDSQVTVIEKSADQFSSDEARLALRAAFAALQGRLVELDGTAPATDAEAAMPSPAIDPAVAETVEAILKEVAKSNSVSPPVASPAPPVTPTESNQVQAETPPPAEVVAAGQTVAHETAFQNADIPEIDTEVDSIQDVDAQDTDAADADAEDEAVLDMIAMEMGAPDPIDDDAIAAAAAEQARLAEQASAAPVIAASYPEPVTTPPAPPPVQQTVQPPPLPQAPAVEMSLGSSLIASGMLRKPITAANDPLAPIRRMSQAEKIAFFS